jgi:undecaprenyl-diphosphatase
MRAGMSQAELTARLWELQRSELRLCRALNRLSQRWIRLLRIVSRIGDGGIWYAHIAIVPWVFGGLPELALLATQGVASTLVYKAIKLGTRRTRPGHHATGDVRLLAAALDRYSFPSGHTQHAVGFSIMLTDAHPALGWYLWPFTALVALSRVALGLHYPTDVAAGAALGAVIAGALLALSG